MFVASVMLCYSFDFKNNVAMADDATVQAEEILPGVSITQNGRVLEMADFEQVGDNYYLYTNQNVTINKTSGNSTYVIVSYGTAVEELAVAGSYYVLAYDTSITAPRETNVRLSLNSLATGLIKEFVFKLVQTNNHFKINPPYVWRDNVGQIVTAPTTAEQYNDYLLLTGLSGSANCPVFVDFYFNNEFYSIYTDNTSGIFKSTITGNTLSDTDTIRFATSGNYQVYIYDKTAYRMFKTVELKASDYSTNTYANKKIENDVTFKCLDVSKYDSSSNSNIQSYTFNVQQTASSANQYDMYVTAATASGTPIIYSQTVNESVKLSFHNLSSIVRRIVVHIDHQLIDGDTNPEDIIIASNQAQITALGKTGITYSDDGEYRIYFYDSTGKILSPMYVYTDGTDVLPNRSYPIFQFTILSNIYKSYHGMNPDDLSGTKVNDNVIVSGTRKDLSTRWYTSLKEKLTATTTAYLKGYNTSSFVLKLAKPNAKIDGIANGGSASDGVTLTAHGVGKITVTVTKDNNTTTQTLTDGGTISGTSEIGSYTVRLVDEMGSQVATTFTIKKSLNVATIALIVVGAAILGIVIFIIVKLRTRIQVR